MAYIQRSLLMPHIARVFQSGNSQAVRLPKELRLNVERVEITQEGDALIVRPHVDRNEPWASLRAALARGFSDDFLSVGRDQPTAKDRPDLDDVFR
jgi:antitoxin VapB